MPTAAWTRGRWTASSRSSPGDINTSRGHPCCLGLRIAEVASCETERHHGSSQLHALRDGLRILFTIGRTSLGARDKIKSSSNGSLPRSDTLSPVTVSVPLDGESSHGKNGLPPDY